MKKIFFSFALILSTFFFIDSVSAEEIYVTSDYRSDFYLPDKLTDLGDYENNYNRAYEYYLNNCVGSYDSYYISKNGYGYGYGSNQVDLLCFNSSNNQITPGVRFGYYSSKKHMFYMQFQIYYSSNKDYSLNFFYNDSSSINNATFTNMEYGPMSQTVYGWFDIRTGELKSNNGIISTNIDLSLINNSNNPIAYSVTEVQGININDTIYNLGDLIYKDGSLASSEIIPEISITKESETIINYNEIDYITDITLNIEFSYIDNDNYLYMYKYGLDSEWTTITLTQSNSFKKTYSDNNILYVQVLDRITNETVISSTFTISSIQDLPLIGDKVTIYFQKITENVDSELYNQCTISQGNISYRACETFSISFDVINYNKYIYEMSLDGGLTWEDVSTRLYNNFFLERVFENKTIYIRVLNRIDYSLNNYSTFTVSTIESTSELGQIVLFQSKYYTERPDIDITALFINYDPINYNYYYSFYSSIDSFVDITDSINCTNNLCTFDTRIYVKGTIYIRIEDKSGNLIYSSTYTVDYYNWINTNNPFDKEDFFGIFFDSFNYFLNPIKEIFNSISIFFDSLPIEIKYTFYVAFVIIIILFLIKFIL